MGAFGTEQRRPRVITTRCFVLIIAAMMRYLDYFSWYSILSHVALATCYEHDTATAIMVGLVLIARLSSIGLTAKPVESMFGRASGKSTGTTISSWICGPCDTTFE